MANRNEERLSGDTTKTSQADYKVLPTKDNASYHREKKKVLRIANHLALTIGPRCDHSPSRWRRSWWGKKRTRYWHSISTGCHLRLMFFISQSFFFPTVCAWVLWHWGKEKFSRNQMHTPTTASSQYQLYKKGERGTEHIKILWGRGGRGYRTALLDFKKEKKWENPPLIFPWK